MTRRRSTREHYLQQASQAESLAERASTPGERDSFAEIARLWRRLAENAPSAQPD